MAFGLKKKLYPSPFETTGEARKKEEVKLISAEKERERKDGGKEGYWD